MQRLYKFLGVGLVSSLLLAGPSYAQMQQSADAEDEPYKSVTTFGVTTNTNSGLLGGFAFRQSKRLSETFLGRPQYRYLAVEIVNVKHPKEVQQAVNFTGSRFTYGKENYLFVVRPQYGREISLFERSADEGISINAIFAVGPSLGIVKPYYVTISESGNRTRTVPASSLYGTGGQPGTGALPTGSGGLFRGFGESKFTAGANVKAAVNFELSAFRNNTTGIEIGFLAELFPSPISIMAGADKRAFFSSGYATLFFGSKK
ncbi:hypothetical protein [Rudanella lutea]|uniref:hypothetical protein n=1 Tax=Rudanella lutea TaxID=451374 RepID=UPI0003616169|nr:hypothetical protein [Rudanella lutea]